MKLKDGLVAFVGIRFSGLLRGVSRQGAVSVDEPDYYCIGCGASGMAFVDSLLQAENESVRVVMADARSAPGGHWNDAYDFARLHQRRYGVESSSGEIPTKDEIEGLASRDEVLDYYANLLKSWKTAGHQVSFLPETRIQDFAAVKAKKFVVDARFTENEIPKLIPPKFKYNVSVITPNDLSSQVNESTQFCILGAGKTGQDAILYLLGQGVAPSSIFWIAPRDAWFTARDPPHPHRQLTSMELLAEILNDESRRIAPAFLRLEKKGLVYRLDPTIEPEKFMDATLNSHQVDLLRTIPKSNIIRGHGRLKEITANQTLIFENDHTITTLTETKEQTTFVHCTTCAFNFKHEPRPVFQPGLITIQEIFSFPGFCLNAAVIAWIAAQSDLDIDQKNALCQLPPASHMTPLPLGEPKGLIKGSIDTPDHPLIIALDNLRRWYNTPGMGQWLHSLRLFSLTMNGYSLDDGRRLAEENHHKTLPLRLRSSS